MVAVGVGVAVVVAVGVAVVVAVVVVVGVGVAVAMNKMPCSISDGEQYDDEPIENREPSYDETRQQEIDAEFAKSVTDKILDKLPDLPLFKRQAE